MELAQGDAARADANGFAGRHRVRFVLLDDAGKQLDTCLDGGTLHVPANRPVSVRIEGPETLKSIRADIDGRTCSVGSGGSLEQILPYYAWGDTDEKVHLRTFNSGVKELRVLTYSDLGKTPLFPPLRVSLQTTPTQE